MVARGLKKAVRELVRAAKLSSMYGELSDRLTAALKTPLTIVRTAQTSEVSIRAEREINVCGYGDPIMEELFGCGVPRLQEKPVWVQRIEIDMVWGSVGVHYRTEDESQSPLFEFLEVPLDRLAAYVMLYWFAKHDLFRSELEKIEWVREVVEFMEPLMDAINTDADATEIDVSIDERLVDYIYLKLLDHVGDISPFGLPIDYTLHQFYQTGHLLLMYLLNELPIGISHTPVIIQEVHRRFKPTYATYYIIDTVNRVKIHDSDLYVYYVGRDGKETAFHIDMSRLTIEKALFLIDLDKSFGTLKFINNVLVKRIERLTRAVRIAEELATLTKIVGGEYAGGQ